MVLYIKVAGIVVASVLMVYQSFLNPGLQDTNLAKTEDSQRSCRWPSKLIKGLGCIHPLNDRFRTWDMAKMECENRGFRLLQGINTRQHLFELRDNFKEYFDGRFSMWIGLNNFKWLDELNPDHPPLHLYIKGGRRQGDDHECGVACIGCANPCLKYDHCTDYRYTLCQEEMTEEEIEKELEIIMAEDGTPDEVEIETKVVAKEEVTPYLTSRDPCIWPAKVIEGLGCIVPLKDRHRSWQMAKTECENRGFRLLQGINTRQHLLQLRDDFKEYFDGKVSMWIGLQNFKWLDSESYPEAPPLHIYIRGGNRQGDDHECGVACIGCTNPSLKYDHCTDFRYTLCQMDVADEEIES